MVLKIGSGKIMKQAPWQKWPTSWNISLTERVAPWKIGIRHIFQRKLMPPIIPLGKKPWKEMTKKATGKQPRQKLKR